MMQLLAYRKKIFDEAVTTYEEYLEKEVTLNGTGETPILQIKARQERAAWQANKDCHDY